MTHIFYAPHHTSNHTTHTTVDPSVEKGARFLNEIEQAAEKRITNRLLVGAEGFDAQFVLYEAHRDRCAMQTQHRVAFKVNGRPFDEIIRTTDDFHDIDPHQVFHQIATAITAQLMTQLFERSEWVGR